MAVVMVRVASSAVRSDIAGKPTNSCLDWKHKAIGQISIAGEVSALNPGLSTQVKTDGIGLFTGQIGWAWNTALLYVKGGAAVTDNHFNVLDTATGIGLVTTGSTRWGGTLGVGFEYAFIPNWSFGIEYDHLWMGNSNNSFTTTDPRFAGFLNDRIRQDVDMLTLRLNYRFGGWGAPVSARY